MITFVATQRCRDGADIIRAEWNGAGYEGRATHYGGSALGRAARKLVEAGCPDDEWQMVGPEGDRRLFGGSLHGLAKLTIIENDGQSVQFALYVPFLPPRSRAGRPPGTEGAVPHVEVDAPCSVDRYTGKWPPGGTEEEDLTEPAS